VLQRRGLLAILKSCPAFRGVTGVHINAFFLKKIKKCILAYAGAQLIHFGTMVCPEMTLFQKHPSGNWFNGSAQGFPKTIQRMLLNSVGWMAFGKKYPKGTGVWLMCPVDAC
jgi:hypothetical protein